jgi:photosystem II stability/assembly factor-like uncharacterized protein
MKKILLVVSIISLAILASACSMIPGSSTTTKKTAPKADGGIFKSTDFGDHWKAVNTVNVTTGQPAANLSNIEVLFLKFDPINSKTIYVSASGSGMYKSIDDGETWTATTLKTGSYPALAIDTRNTKVFYTLKGNTVLKSVDDMATWFTSYVETRPGQSLLDLAIDTKQPNIVYAATTSSIIISKNYGNDWDLSEWKTTPISRLYMSEKNSQTIYVLTSKGISKSTDGAKTWVDLAPSLAKFTGATKIYWSIFDPKTEAMLISTKYGLLRSMDGGTTWQETLTLFEHKKITVKPVVYNAVNTNQVLMAIKTVIQKTYDNGSTWSSLKSIATSRRVHYLITDPSNPDTVFAGTLRPAQ